MTTPDHPFRDLVTRADLFPDICGHDVYGMPCGFSRADHVQPEDDDPRGDDGPYSHEADGYMRRP